MKPELQWESFGKHSLIESGTNQKSNMNPRTAQKPKTKSRNTPKTQVIHFEFTDPDAAVVAIAGTFNDWRPDATPMICLGDGCWVKKLALPPGTYKYCFVVDGEWLPDPRSSETFTNPFGGLNTVLRVGNPESSELVQQGRYETGRFA